jgi:hypothetical protein
MSKNQYSDIQRAMIYGSFLVLDNSQQVAELYQQRFGWTLDRRTVERISEKFQNSNIFKNYPGAGRPTEVDESTREMMIETLGEEHKTLKAAATKIKVETGKKLHKSTLSRHTKELGLVYEEPKVTLNLSSEDKDSRIQYADKIAALPAESLVWEDESFFPLKWEGSSKQWMLKEERLETMQDTSRTGVHILGVISLRGHSELFFLPAKETWYSETYCNGLERVLLPFWNKYHKTRENYFIQDNASCHISAQTRGWLQKHCIKRLPHPVRSPDINPIEMIWAILKQQTYSKGSFKDRDSLCERINETWKAIPDEIFIKCIHEVLYNRLLNHEYIYK